jgi:histidine kinase
MNNDHMRAARIGRRADITCSIETIEPDDRFVAGPEEQEQHRRPSSPFQTMQEDLLTAVAHLEPVPVSILAHALNGESRCWALKDLQACLDELCEKDWLTVVDKEDGGKENGLYSFASASRLQQYYDYIVEDEDGDEKKDPAARRRHDGRHLEYGRRVWRSVATAASSSPAEDLTQASPYIVQQCMRHHSNKTGRVAAAADSSTSGGSSSSGSTQTIIIDRDVYDVAERHSLARLCLLAGQTAAKSSAFTSALAYLEFGIALLQLDDAGDESGGCWHNVDTYDCTLALHNAAAEMLLVQTEYVRMERYIDVVLRHATQHPHDTLLAKCTRLQAMGASGDQNAAIDYAIDILATLGEKLPRRGHLWQSVWSLAMVKRRIGSRSDADLLGLPPMTDPNKLMCMRIVNAIFLRTLFVRPSLVALTACKFMELTLRYGMSAMSANAFSCYSFIMATIGDLRSADRFGRLSVVLLEQIGIIESLPRVYAAYYGGVCAVTHPSRDSLPKLLHGYDVGQQTGDLESACLNVSLYCCLALAAGVTLTEIQTTWEHSRHLMESLKQEALLRFSRPSMRAVYRYMGIDDDGRTGMETAKVDSDRNDDDEACQWFKANHMEPMILQMRVPQLFVGYIFDDDSFPYLEYCIKSAHNCAGNESVVEWICSLCLLKLARSGHIGKRKALRYVRRKALPPLRRLQKFCPINFLDKVCLLEAEVAALQHRVDEALSKYICAAALAHQAKRTYVEALANERAGRFLLELQRAEDHDDAAARNYITAAHDCYKRWAAHAKVKKLEAEFRFLRSSGS